MPYEKPRVMRSRRPRRASRRHRRERRLPTTSPMSPRPASACQSIGRRRQTANGRGRTEIIETTVGRLIFNEILPAGVAVAVTGGIDFINETMDRKMLKTVVARLLRGARQRGHGRGRRQDQEHRLRVRDAVRHHDRGQRHAGAGGEGAAHRRRRSSRSRRSTSEYEMGLITEQERYDATVEVWSRTTEEVKTTIQEQLDRSTAPSTLMATSGAKGNISQITPDGRHARPDDRPVRPDHRPADPVELPRGPHGARVLHLDARRPQGSGRHGAPHGGLRLPDAPSHRRRAGRDHRSRTTAARAWASGSTSRTPACSSRSASASSAVTRAMDLEDPETGEVLVDRNEEIDERSRDRIEAAEDGARVRALAR